MNTYNQPEASNNPTDNLATPEAKEGSLTAAGEEKPLVKIVPAEAATVRSGRSIGFVNVAVLIPDDFDRMGEDDILVLFEGDS
jgi:hypothetical protein